MPFKATERCRECGAGIMHVDKTSLWRDVCGAVSCLMSGHAHQPWPEIMFREREIAPGVAIMARVAPRDLN